MNYIISKSINYFLHNKGARFVRLFLLACTLPVLGTAQVKLHYQADNLTLYEPDNFISGKIEITVTNTSTQHIDSLTWILWPNAYLDPKSNLAKELLSMHNASMHFADANQLGEFQYQKIELKSGENTQTIFSSNAETEYQEQLKLPINLAPNQRKTLIFTLNLWLPNAQFNGFGVAKNNIRLTQWLPRISAALATQEPTLNSLHRTAYFVPATFNLHINFTTPKTVVSNLKTTTSEGGATFSSEQPVADAAIILYNKAVTYPLQGVNHKVSMTFSGTVPPFNQSVSWQNVSEFLKREIGWETDREIKLAFVENNTVPTSGNLFLLNSNLPQDALEGELVAAIVNVLLREKLGVNPAQEPWLTNGMANFYKHLYFQQYYPQKKLVGDFANTLVAKFFDVAHYPITQQNRMAFLYMARQGLDQALNLPLNQYSRANQNAIVNGKAALVFGYVRSYTGQKDFIRSMHRWFATDKKQNTAQDFQAQIAYYCHRNTDWILGDLYRTNKKLDYKLKRVENCTSVYTATIKNKGHLIAPFSITGYKDTVPVLTEWFAGHNKTVTRQIHLEDYTKVILDADANMPELSQKNNLVKTRGLFKQLKPLKLQFYTSFDNPKKTQIFWLPSIKYNAYDKLLIGAQFYNNNVFVKPFEYLIAPDYSTGTGQLTGIASFKFNFTPQSNWFHRISLGIYGRYYHYAENLGYTRLSPTLKFYLRKHNARSPWNQTIRLRSVSVDRETTADMDPGIMGNQPANYQIFDAQWRAEKGTLLNPFLAVLDVQAAQNFYKVSATLLQRWRLSKNHLFTARLFAGVTNTKTDYFQFGLSGTTDYLFDYYFIGRSDDDGIWSQQFFVTDGGFKSATQNTMVQSLISANVNVPFYRFFGVFADVAFAAKLDETYWDYGFYVEFIPDFIEIYFPIQNSNTLFLDQPNYMENIRFVLNLKLDEIINRARRGWY